MKPKLILQLFDIMISNEYILKTSITGEKPEEQESIFKFDVDFGT